MDLEEGEEHERYSEDANDGETDGDFEDGSPKNAGPKPPFSLQK